MPQVVAADFSGPDAALLQHDGRRSAARVSVRPRHHPVLRYQRVRHPPVYDGDLTYGDEDPRRLLLAHLSESAEADEDRAGRDDDRPGGQSAVQRCQQVRHQYYIPPLSVDRTARDHRYHVLHVLLARHRIVRHHRCRLAANVYPAAR